MVSKMEATPKIPDWLNLLIRLNLSSLLALQLEKSPPADQFKIVCGVWAGIFARRSAAWDQKKDASRVQKAFDLIIENSDHWPTPKAIFEAMPERKIEGLTYQYRKPTEAERENKNRLLEEMKAVLADKITNAKKDSEKSAIALATQKKQTEDLWKSMQE